MADVNKQIEAEQVQLEKVNINSPDTGLSHEKCQKQNKLEVQGNMNSLESSNTLSNSLSVTGSDVDLGNFSPMGGNLSKTSPPHEQYQKQIENLEQMLNKKDEIVTGIQDKYKHFKEFIRKY